MAKFINNTQLVMILLLLNMVEDITIMWNKQAFKNLLPENINIIYYLLYAE